ncbi:MAG: amino acid ABC transporter permease [Pseudomonadota bacterium]
MADQSQPALRPGWQQWLTDRLYDPKSRGLAFQLIVVLGIVWLGYAIVTNTIENLEKQGITSGFGFLDRTAGFDISQKLISYETTSTYGRAFLVGLMNTLLVAALGIVIATLVGFIVGIARLSSNKIIQFLATTFVELIRNIPPLLMLLFIYFGVLKNLPQPRESIALPLSSVLNVRGLYVPSPIWGDGSVFILVALLGGLIAAVVAARRAEAHRVATGEHTPMLWRIAAMVFVPPVLVFSLLGFPLAFDAPEVGRFNVSGGLTIQPELVALVVGLSLYTAAFIAEIVRSGILGVPKGQKEAAAALGLRDGQVMRQVVIPQALRIIIPPLTNQYLNLTKNSSLAVAIGYPDLVSVFGNTVLSQTNQAVEVILIIMAVYLTISIATSLVMNWFNRRMALVER